MRKGFARRIAATAAAVAASAMLLAAPATASEMSSGCELLNSGMWDGYTEWVEWENFAMNYDEDPPDSARVEFWPGDRLMIRSTGGVSLDIAALTEDGERAGGSWFKQHGTFVLVFTRGIYDLRGVELEPWYDGTFSVVPATFEVTCTSNPKRNR